MELENYNTIFYMKAQKTLFVTVFLSKKHEFGCMIILDLKTYYRSLIAKMTFIGIKTDT
jgi:hypothetical protein